MSQNPVATDIPLDLSSIGMEPVRLPASAASSQLQEPMRAVPSAMERPARLVEISKLAPADLDEAEGQAELVNFRDTSSLLSHGEGSLKAMGEVTHQLLSQATLGKTGEVGALAASVLDGVKLLRIEDLMREASEKISGGSGSASRKAGFFQRLLGTVHEVKTAAAGFAENRKKFDAVLDGAEKRAQAGKADLMRLISRFDEFDVAIRGGVHRIKVSIAGAQIALDRGYGEEEGLRQKALVCTDQMEAMALSADLMAYRDALANFRAKTATMREALLQAATMIPIVASNRRAASTRVMKIDNGILFVMPNLRMAAAQAVGQYAISGVGAEGERLDAANRQIMALTSRNAHEVAVSAARSLGVDQRNVDALRSVTEQSIATLNEVISIDEENARADEKREAELVGIRDTLVRGLQSAQRRVVNSAAPSRREAQA